MPHVPQNPFTPTFGHVPFAIAGRVDYIDDIVEGLANRPGDPNRSTIFVGPRGSGKTVLLTELARIASGQGWVSLNVSAREGMLEEMFYQLNANAGHVLAPDSPADITSVRIGPIGVSREMRPERSSWRSRMGAAIDELAEQGIGVLFTVDEINPDCEEFLLFIDAYQHFVREQKDVAFLLAGLPSRVSSLLVDDSTSFIRRAFQRPLGPIRQIEVEEALLSTFLGNGRTIEPEALAAAAEATGGFAFAIQLIGYYLWRQGCASTALTVEDVETAVGLAEREMERSVFTPTLKELRPREEEYLVMMAQDNGPSVTSDIARRMGIGMSNASNLRRRLIEFGVIREVRMGLVEFEVPLLKEYLRKRGTC